MDNAAANNDAPLVAPKIARLRQRLSDDLAACDLQWTLFVAAAKSSRHDKQLSPYPSQFALASASPAIAGDRVHLDIDAILRLIDAVPMPLRNVRWPAQPPAVVDLLHWVLCEHGANTVRLHSLPAAQHGAVLASVECEDVTTVAPPLHVFRVAIGEAGTVDAAKEDRFRVHRADRRTRFAFHGSKLECFHSISAHGLQQHLCKRAMVGEGIYLSSELHVSLPFSSIGGSWPGSELGTELSCMAVCEFVDHEEHLKRREGPLPALDEFPDKYFVITNNDIVRVRYLLLFGKPIPATTTIATAPSSLDNRAQPPSAALLAAPGRAHVRGRPGRLRQLISRHWPVLTVLAYALLLLFVGFINSRTAAYWRERFWQKVESWWSNDDEDGEMASWMNALAGASDATEL